MSSPVVATIAGPASITVAPGVVVPSTVTVGTGLGDMLKSENLSGLASVTASRANLGVSSTGETIAFAIALG